MFAVTFAISRSSILTSEDKTGALHWRKGGGGGSSVLIADRGDVHN